jgi:hypothetical protein
LINKHCFNVPIVLVGTNEDLREENDKTHVDLEDAKMLHKMIASKEFFTVTLSDQKSVDVKFEFFFTFSRKFSKKQQNLQLQINYHLSV